MRQRPARPLKIGLTLAVGVVFGIAGATSAVAHEERAAGGIRFVVGWGQEPAYTGLKNSVEVTVSEAGGRPVNDLGDGLKVEVIKGSERVTLPLEASFAGGEAAGTYHAWLTPTRPGSYTFHLTGNVRGQNVDESFTSSPNTFDEVEDVSKIQFPAKEPSAGQLATRLDREVPRLETRTDEVEAALDEADDRVDSARTVAVVGVVVGALGLLAGAGALVATRRGSARDRLDIGVATTRSEHAGSLHR
jgi:hypothetical protein